jgi:hypothetical protein
MVWCLFRDREEVEQRVGELVQHGELPFDERERLLLRVSTRCNPITSPVRVFHRQATAGSQVDLGGAT